MRIQLLLNMISMGGGGTEGHPKGMSDFFHRLALRDEGQDLGFAAREPRGGQLRRRELPLMTRVCHDEMPPSSVREQRGSALIMRMRAVINNWEMYEGERGAFTGRAVGQTKFGWNAGDQASAL